MKHKGSEVVLSGWHGMQSWGIWNNTGSISCLSVISIASSSRAETSSLKSCCLSLSYQPVQGVTYRRCWTPLTMRKFCLIILAVLKFPISRGWASVAYQISAQILLIHIKWVWITTHGEAVSPLATSTKRGCYSLIRNSVSVHFAKMGTRWKGFLRLSFRNFQN